MTNDDTTTEAGRSIELEVEVPGTPEEVWHAIATGPGISSWFIPMDIDERVGGKVTMDFGDFGKSSAEVTVWDPPNRVVFEGPEERTLAYEWLVESRGGGTCIVRLVNSGFGSGEDWDGEYHGMTEGWRIFMQNLRLQLTHFRGRAARAVIPTVMVPGPKGAAWKTLCDALGFPVGVAEGDRVHTADGVPPLSGVVETRMSSEGATAILLVLDAPAPGTAFVTIEGDGDTVAASVYLYLYDGPAAAGDEWGSWLKENLPESVPVET